MKKMIFSVLVVMALGLTACQNKEQTNMMIPTTEPTATSIPTAINMPTATPKPTSTPTPEVTVTEAPAPTLAPTSTSKPIVTPTSVPTLTPTPEPTATPMPTSTLTPTAILTPVPTVTLEPTVTPTPQPTTIPTMSTMEVVKDMGIGINLGNTYESCGDWIAQYGDGTPESYEKAWGSPVITEQIIKGYADEGFGAIRIPVAWSNLMGDNYTISPAYAEAVKEVVDWALKYDLYVIVNLHYDSGWLENFPTDKENCMKKYCRIWEQVSELFKDYGEKLIFESQNEELGWFSVWNYYAGNAGKEESYALVNEINQNFVNIVRSSGGKNADRHLLISGYNTDIVRTCDSLFKMPDDAAGRCAVSVHYYTPPVFAILTEDADWGKAAPTWGSEAEQKELKEYMDMLKVNFVDKGIPVIIGEYGCPTKNKEPESVRLFLSSVCKEAYERGMCPMLWSTTGEHYDRDNCRMIDAELAKAFRDIIE